MNPATLRAMLQMQQAMGQLGSTPGLQGLMPPGTGMPPAGGSAAAPAPPAGGLDFSSLLGATGSAPAAAPPLANPFSFPFVPPAAATQQQQAPGQRFRQQLQNLEGMGFTDRSANIRALTSSHGNVNRAVEILLESPPEMGGGEDDTRAAAESQANNDATTDDGAGESSEPKGTAEKKND